MISRVRAFFGNLAADGGLGSADKAGGSAPSRAQAENLAARLGYGPRARLLIVHADDLGLAHAVNASFIDGFATGLINSGSAMVPCPCFPDIADFARTHPEADLGLHLTLTSERVKDLWTPVAPKSDVPSLVDDHGYFLQRWTPETRISPREVEIELRAQIETARAAGFRPTHLDSHQFRLQLTGNDLSEVYLRISRDYRLPVLLTRGWLARYPYLKALVTQDDIVLDRIAAADAEVAPDQWSPFYCRVLKGLPVGVSEVTIHPGYDGAELRAFFGDRPGWGAAWRQRDFDFFTSDTFRALLRQEEITLITWREIASRLH